MNGIKPDILLSLPCAKLRLLILTNDEVVMSTEITADETMIAACGLYCGACGRYLKGKCPGCAENEKASWCGIRSCCRETEKKSCADCKEFSDVSECKKFNNFIGRMFGFVFNSNRKACIEEIRSKGYKGFSKDMAGRGVATIKRRG